MAISRTRITAPLTRGNVPEEHAAEFTDALIDEVERELEPLAAKSEIEEAIGRALEPVVAAMEDLRQDMREQRRDMRELRQEMGELRQQVQDQRVQIADSEARLRQEMGELRQEMQDQRVHIADSETRQSHRLLVFAVGMIGVNFSMIAVAVGIILGFN